MNKKPAPLPSAAQIRQKLLKRITEAKFPKDLDHFTWAELDTAGLLRGHPRQSEWSDKTFRLFVLMAEQAKALRKQRDHLRHELELHKPYLSPHSIAAFVEPCPVKRNELMRRADEEERQVNEQRRKERERMPDLNMLAIARRKWANRDTSDLFFSFRRAKWHEPMTLMGYHEATGLSRRTVQNILKRIGARPLTERKRRNEPSRYGIEANAAVLRDWLTRRVKDLHARGALLAQTLVYYRHEWPDHYRWLVDLLIPALCSLGLETEASIAEFRAYLGDCEKVMYPPPPPSPFGPFSDLFSIPPPKSEST